MDNRLRKRKNRRRAVAYIIRRLDEIQDFELEYCLSIPNTKANKVRLDESDFAFCSIFDIVESLKQLF